MSTMRLQIKTKASPSSRKAGIEIETANRTDSRGKVAFLTEGGD